MNSISLSLICATLGRYSELQRLIDSLTEQTATDFELIVVDQNSNELILPLMHKASIRIKHIQANVNSNTAARNLGLLHAEGIWVGFPDDDCWYSSEFVSKLILRIRESSDIDGLFVNWEDPLSKKKMFNFEEGQMKLIEAFNLASCICMFFHRATLLDCGGFSEKFGLGSATVVKAGEEQELLFRLLRANKKIFKDPTLNVYHLISNRPWNENFIERIKSQGACDIYFTRKYIGLSKTLTLIIRWALAAGYNALRLNRKNFLWYAYKLWGGIFYQPRI